LGVLSIAYAAISWPSSAPSGEVDGGKYSAKLTPSGAVIAFNLSACPTGWIAANGSNGTPDLRGEFIRGLDSGRGVDGSRTLASAQDFDWKSFSITDTLKNSTEYTHDNVYVGKSTSVFIGNLFTGYWQSPAAAI